MTPHERRKKPGIISARVGGSGAALLITDTFGFRSALVVPKKFVSPQPFKILRSVSATKVVSAASPLVRTKKRMLPAASNMLKVDAATGKTAAKRCYIGCLVQRERPASEPLFRYFTWKAVLRSPGLARRQCGGGNGAA